MKKIFTIVALLSLSLINAQTLTVQQSEEQFKKEMLDRDKKALLIAKENSSLIIEGTVVKCDEYFNKSKSAVYTQYTVKMKNVFKGSISDSIIEFIKYRDYGDEVLPLEFYPAPQKNLASNYNVILYGNPNILELNESTTNNTNIFDVYRQTIIVIQQVSNPTLPIAQYNHLTFMSKKDLYETMGFFVKSLQSEKLLEAQNPTKKQINDFINHTNKATNIVSKSSSVATAITFSFQNAVTTGTSSQKYYEFDVSAFGSSSEYLDFAQVDIDYAPAAFGNSVVAASNVTVTQVPAFPASNYPYFVKYDNNTNILRVLMSADFNTPNRLQLTTNITPLFHVKMKVTCNQNVNLSFTGSTGAGYAPSATNTITLTNYSPVNDNDFDGTTACALNILSFSPTQINGGRNEILTINGVNFGATQGTGYVKLKNANDGGNTFIQLDADDYLSWSNTQIKIIVPSFQRATTPVGEASGSGVIFVSNGSNTVTSAASLNVFYSQLNYLDPNAPFPSGFTSRKERIYSTGNPPTNNYFRKYPIRIDSASCAPFPGALACIKKAIAYWVCETKIPFIIIGTTTFTSSVPTDNSPGQNVLDGVSTIRFSDFSLSPGGPTNAIGKTFFRARRCDTAFAGKVIGTLPEFDIEFDSNQTWFCDTSTYVAKPTNTYDFYEVALHEFGHADLLKHNNAFNSMMWYGSTFTSSLSPGNRRIFLNIMDYLGGSQIITDSKNISYSANCAFFAVNTENCTGIIGIHENSSNLIDIVVQPNPFADDLLISLKTDKKSDIKLTLVDVMGRTIKQFEEVPNAIGETKIYYDGKELQTGIYFLKIQINNDVVIKKVIKH